MLGAWARRAKRGTRKESRLGVCGEEGGLRAERGGLGGGALSARSVGKEGRVKDSTRIRVWSVR